MPHRLEQQPQEHERLKRNHIANEVTLEPQVLKAKADASPMSCRACLGTARPLANGGQQLKHEPRTTRRGPRRAHRRRRAPWTPQSVLIGRLGASRQARRC